MMHFPEKKLDAVLVNFWFSCCTKTGEHLSMATLANIRHALNRKLKRHGREFDITRDARFVKSQEAFKDACCKLRSVGKAAVKHFPEITPQGDFVSFFLKYFLLSKNLDLHTMLKK